MVKKVYYEKRGRRYYPVSEYDSNLLDGLPKGSHLLQIYPGGQSTRYHVEPNYAAMIAAGRLAEDAISKALMKASDLRPKTAPITPEQKAAWDNLVQVFGPEARYLEWPSAREACESAVAAMVAEADKLMQNEAVKLAYDHFHMVVELTKKMEENDD
jgi:hypothetical protein